MPVVLRRLPGRKPLRDDVAPAQLSNLNMWNRRRNGLALLSSYTSVLCETHLLPKYCLALSPAIVDANH